MFAWYRNAAVCYAFLPDVPPGDVPHAPDSHFRASAWFTRGWTLQELLAPSRLVFYNARWACLGTKCELSLVIENITGISRAVLVGVKGVHQSSVAQRLSWAANRVTTRREDAAYCLLGILGVTMPGTPRPQPRTGGTFTIRSNRPAGSWSRLIRRCWMPWT
jgi:hypothetical protein